MRASRPPSRSTGILPVNAPRSLGGTDPGAPGPVGGAGILPAPLLTGPWPVVHQLARVALSRAGVAGTRSHVRTCLIPTAPRAGAIRASTTTAPLCCRTPPRDASRFPQLAHSIAGRTQRRNAKEPTTCASRASISVLSCQSPPREWWVAAPRTGVRGSDALLSGRTHHASGGPRRPALACGVRIGALSAPRATANPYEPRP